MKRLVSSMSGGQKGFTLIELLVVVAILGVIAAVVALNVAGFFGRGTLQAANTELHQVQTAIISAMAECESSSVSAGTWSGGSNVIVACNKTVNLANVGDAAHYVYGPFRATYTVGTDGSITGATCAAEGQWGNSIQWSSEFMNWRTATP